MRQAESEFAKQRALLEQKIKFLEQNLAEAQERETTHSSELLQRYSAISLELKTATAKYEAELQQKTSQVETKLE